MAALASDHAFQLAQNFLLSALLITVIPLTGACFALPDVEFMFVKFVILLVLLVTCVVWFFPVLQLCDARFADDCLPPSPLLLWSLITLHMILATSKNFDCLNFLRMACNSDF